MSQIPIAWLINRGVWKLPPTTIANWWCRWYTSHRPLYLFLPIWGILDGPINISKTKISGENSYHHKHPMNHRLHGFFMFFRLSTSGGLSNLGLVRGIFESVFALPSGFLADRLPRPQLIFMGSVIWGAGLVGCAFSPESHQGGVDPKTWGISRGNMGKWSRKMVKQRDFYHEHLVKQPDMWANHHETWWSMRIWRWKMVKHRDFLPWRSGETHHGSYLEDHPRIADPGNRKSPIRSWTNYFYSLCLFLFILFLFFLSLLFL